MIVNKDSPAHLTYCLNVHPGETWEENLAAIRTYALAVRDRVSPRKPFGLGLRLSDKAGRRLAQPRVLRDFRNFLFDNGLYVFTINGFPFGEFHGPRVKERVYRPDWRTPQRLDYTCRLSRILAQLLPEGTVGSISTVPGSWKPWVRTRHDRAAIVARLAEAAATLHDLRRLTGREIVLALEPEPDCLLETTDEALAFFGSELPRHGAPVVARRTGLPRGDAEAILRRHVGVCFDTCHMAVQFEDLRQSLRKLLAGGVRVAKIQTSAALRAPPRPDRARELTRFCDPVYLHQVKAATRRNPRLAYGDLEDLLRAALSSRPPSASSASLHHFHTCGNDSMTSEWRVHCHVPLYFTRLGSLLSTASDLTPDFLRDALAAGVPHFEIETYTFSVLPSRAKKRSVVESLAAEYRWLLRRFAQARAAPRLRQRTG
jgi:sugar phosphate isomerase/epimerase